MGRWAGPKRGRGGGSAGSASAGSAGWRKRRGRAARGVECGSVAQATRGRPPSSGASGGRPRACGCERGGRSQLRLARSPAGRRPGDQKGRGRRCRKPTSAGGGLQDEEGLCPFALLPPARPPASTAPPRGLSRTAPGPILPAARLTRGPGNGVANSQGRARSGRKLEPREQRPRSVAQPEKLAAAAPFGPASLDLLLQGLKKREPR